MEFAHQLLQHARVAAHSGRADELAAMAQKARSLVNQTHAQPWESNLWLTISKTLTAAAYDVNNYGSNPSLALARIERLIYTTPTSAQAILEWWIGNGLSPEAAQVAVALNHESSR